MNVLTIERNLSKIESPKLKSALKTYINIANQTATDKEIDTLAKDLHRRLTEVRDDFFSEYLWGTPEEIETEYNKLIIDLKYADTHSEKVVAIDNAVNKMHTDTGMLNYLYIHKDMSAGPSDEVYAVNILSELAGIAVAEEEIPEKYPETPEQKKVRILKYLQGTPEEIETTFARLYPKEAKAYLAYSKRRKPRRKPRKLEEPTIHTVPLSVQRVK